VLHDLDIEFILLIHRVIVDFILVILEPIQLERIYVHTAPGRDISTIDHHSTASSYTPSEGWNIPAELLVRRRGMSNSHGNSIPGIGRP
jgi:hypothetical protein